MTLVTLTGCRSTPLLSYIQSLGVLRILDEQHAPGLTSFWDNYTLHIEGNLSRESITAFFTTEYKPTPILSPWNKGGGFRTLKYEKGEKAVVLIETSTDERFVPIQQAIRRVRYIWERGKTAGWIEEGWKQEPSKKDKYYLHIDKPRVLAACRAALPDEALDWLDAAVVLSDDRSPRYSPLLGTGGNLGRGDLSSNYLEALALLLKPSRMKTNKQLLNHSLFSAGTPELRSTLIGQFDPRSAGGMNSWAFDGGKTLVNLWNFVLGMEGSLLFASGIARRFGGSQGLATMPFTVAGNSAGFASAERETVKGEFWAPLWRRPLTVAELRRIIAEGRISWGGTHAKHGLDAAKALASLGVDRGLDRFERFVIADNRFGNMTLAVPIGSYQVHDRPAKSVQLLHEIDPWVDRLRSSRLPNAAASALRRVDRAQLEVVHRPESPEPLQELLGRLFDLEWIVSYNADLKQRVRGPLPLLPWDSWVALLDDNSIEWRLALAIASQRDRLGQSSLSVREQRRGAAAVFIRPVQLPTRRHWIAVDWSDTSTGSGQPDRHPIEDRLSEMVISRAPLCSDRRFPADSPVVGSGVPIAFDRAIAPVGRRELTAFLNHQISDHRLARLISVASLLARPTWRRPEKESDASQPTPSGRDEHTWDGYRPVSPLRGVLGPFFHSRPILITNELGNQEERVLAPIISWPRRLKAGQTEGVIREAIIRLRAAGLRPGIRPEAIDGSSAKRVLASLAIPIYPRTVEAALETVCPPLPESIPRGA